MQYTMLKTIRGPAARLTVLALLAALASGAWAAPEDAGSAPAARQDAAPAPSQTNAMAVAATAAPASTRADGALDFGPAADLGKLDQSRGGTDTHNNNNLSGVVSGNSATNVVTGNNVIDSGAFANMSGIPVVIQNSGANVLIQSSTIVNLQFK